MKKVLFGLVGFFFFIAAVTEDFGIAVLITVILIIIVVLLMSVDAGDSGKNKSLKDYEALEKKRFDESQFKVLQLEAKINSGFVEAVSDKTAKFLFIDFETTGIPPFYTMPDPDIIDSFPYVVQACCLVFNRNCELVDQYSSIINPGDVHFPKNATKVHGIDKAKAMAEGASVLDFLSFFKKHLNVDCLVVAHNVQFDSFMLKLEAKRNKFKLSRFKTFCTMKSTKNDVAIYKEYGHGYKYPKLKELVEHTFTNGYSIGGLKLHSASLDAQLCALCFFEKKMHLDYV